MSSLPYDFPAYRSSEWMQLPLSTPLQILASVNLQPSHMQYFPNDKLFQVKSSLVREQIRTCLFRHALYKVQNVEVMDSSCSSNSRQLISVSPFSPSPSFLPQPTPILSELWEIRRCSRSVFYHVLYFSHHDVFSVTVSPRAWSDKFRAFRFAYLES